MRKTTGGKGGRGWFVLAENGKETVCQRRHFGMMTVTVNGHRGQILRLVDESFLYSVEVKFWGRT